MNIEESIKIVKCLILYPTNWIVNKEKYKGNLKYIGSIEGNEAIETLLTAYEKEKEKVESFEYALSNGEVTTINNFDNNVPTKLIGSYTYGKEVVNFIKRNFVSKNKLKEIIYPTPENEIPIEVQQSDMYKKLVKKVEE